MHAILVVCLLFYVTYEPWYLLYKIYLAAPSEGAAFERLEEKTE